MKAESAACFVAAAAVHAVLLFGFRMETPAHPLALSDEPSAVDVTLVAAPLELAPAPTPPEPAPTPEPPEPQPTPEVPTPPPAPTPDQETMPAPESTPVPERPKPAPRRQAERHSAMPHTAPGPATALPGAANGPLSSRARYLSNPKPDYPDEARRQHQQGVVMLDVEVDSGGRPSNVTLSRSSGFPMLDDAALQAVRRWRFDPARAAGLPVPSRVQVPVRFSLSE